MAYGGLGSLAEKARELGENVAMVARLTRDLPGYLRTTLTADEARSHLLDRLATRAERFVTVVERAIYAHPRSPYLQLLRHAACELGDFKALVAREGVDGALEILSERGVFVSFDEFKGRREAVRGSQRFTFREQDFDNPLARPHFVLYTGGSGGRPSRVGFSLALIDEWAEAIATVLEAHGVHRPRMAFWWPVALPRMVAAARMGQPVAGWFYPVHPLPTLVHLAARYQVLLGRLAGVHFPLPRRCDLETPEQMVEWLSEQLRAGQPIVV